MLKSYSKESSRKFNLKITRVLPLSLIVIGFVAIFYVISPIVIFQLNDIPRFTSVKLTSPIPDVLVTSIINLTGVDYAKASNWFPNATGFKREKPENPLSYYLLSIPKLGIQNAMVSTTSDDLFKNLVHYGGSSLPGEKGNTVIFGHSTLPQLFNPKNYKTIFSTLHNLKVGDELAINVDGVIYKYSIFEIKVIDPQDISVLEQKYDKSYITVITCTPPGTYWKRLVIKANLEKLGQT